MPLSNSFLCGVVEGFYGRPWSFATRFVYADFLCHAGLNCYIYCPKSDPYLRKRWREKWPEHEWRQLQHLSSHYKHRGLLWVPGLSPFALYTHYGARERGQLRAKVEQILELQPGRLAILFDDMPGNVDALACRQAEIMADIRHWAPGLGLLLCPTYYSFDPVLEHHFGERPEHYWEELGRQVDCDVAFFWTGNDVCSETVSASDIRAINALLGRQVTLWDNYPVNDGAERSKFLYLEPLTHRDTALRHLLSGHLCNPMNEGLLSLPALGGLATLHGKGSLDRVWLAQVLGEGTWQLLQRDGPDFQCLGLQALMENGRVSSLLDDYEQQPGEAAAEVVGWLRGDYGFDPACLTD